MSSGMQKSNHKDKLKSIIKFILPISILLYILFSNYQNKIEQNILQRDLSLLNYDQIQSIEITFIKNYKASDKVYKLSNDDILMFLSKLEKMDNTVVGGHNRKIYECIISVRLKTEEDIRLVGSVFSLYDWNKDALYIHEYNYNKSKEGNYLSGQHNRPMRVPGMGKWMMSKWPN